MKNYSIGLVTGILLTASALMFMGANSKNMGDITADRITLVSELGKTIIVGGALGTFNSDGKETSILGTGDDGGGGLLRTYNSDGKMTSYLGTDESGGHLETYNKHGVIVGFFGTDKNQDGVIALFDRYGDFGWGERGKQ